MAIKDIGCLPFALEKLVGSQFRQMVSKNPERKFRMIFIFPLTLTFRGGLYRKGGGLTFCFCYFFSTEGSSFSEFYGIYRQSGIFLRFLVHTHTIILSLYLDIFSKLKFHHMQVSACFVPFHAGCVHWSLCWLFLFHMGVYWFHVLSA